jgi:hypothetical protein
MDLTSKSDAEIDTWISNHERLKKTDTELFRSLVVERGRRHGRGLSIDVSMQAMMQAAKNGKFISYGELAEANGIAWTKARHLMNGKHGHLDNLLAHCHANGLPLFTAIVVQKGKLESGDMEDFTLAGFVEGAERIGCSVTDDHEFLRLCQEACFTWTETK